MQICHSVVTTINLYSTEQINLSAGTLWNYRTFANTFEQYEKSEHLKTILRRMEYHYTICNNILSGYKSKKIRIISYTLSICTWTKQTILTKIAPKHQTKLRHWKKSPTLCYFKLDWDEMLQDSSATKHTSMYRVRFPLRCDTFKMAAMTSACQLLLLHIQ